MADTAADFKLFITLLSDIEFLENFAACKQATNIYEAVNYLEQGFDYELAKNITAYYLHWVPEINRICVIFTDSIPIITESDFDFLDIKLISADKVQLERTYDNCFAENDQYLYQIGLKKAESRWIITSLTLTKIK